MAAAIVKHWFLENHENPHIEDGSIRVLEDISDTLDFIGYNYGDPIPDLSEYDKVIMCDISFPLTNMLEINDRLMDSETLETNFIWIDHHISAIKSNITVETEGLRNTNFAACELTWKHLMQGMRGDPNKESTNNSMPEIVRLLGLYDSFNHTRKNNFTREEINDCLDNKFYHHKDSRENAIDDWFHGIDVKLKKALPRANDEQKVLEFQYGARGVIMKKLMIG
ncbi:MAG: hypothetical protein PF569_00175 [Candidatus Woesearchaeota archaeon]|jgi:hypothetical protein|nr:hypothetical protein [Candidatus Woesearchaeota archaeon]